MTFVRAAGLTDDAPSGPRRRRARSTPSRTLLAKDADNLARRRSRVDDEDARSPRSPGCCRRCSSSERRARRSRWSSPGRGVLVAERERWAEGRYLAVDLQLVCERNDDQAGGEVDRALTCLSRRVAGARRRGRHLVARRRSRSRSSTRSGSARTCARASGSPSRSSPTRSSRRRAAQGLDPLPAERGAAARQAVAAVPLPDPVPALRRGVARAGRAADRRARVRPGYSLDRLRELTLVELTDPARAGAAPTSTTRSPCSSGSSTRGTTPTRPSRTPTGVRRRAHLPLAARRPVPARGHRAHRRGRARQRRAPAGAAPPAAEQGEPGPRPRLHLLRRARHQPARRGLRGPDVLHRLLRRDRPLRGRQGRQRREGLVGRAGRPRRGHRRQGLRHDDRPGHRRAASRSLHRRGTFVFRLAGRERQQSASYYTPEVLTRFVVSPGAGGAARPGRPHAPPPRRSSS